MPYCYQEDVEHHLLRWQKNGLNYSSVIDACLVLVKTGTVMAKQSCIHAHFGTCWATSETSIHRHTRKFQQDSSAFEWRCSPAASVSTDQNTGNDWQYNETYRSQQRCNRSLY
jgi:hypothetical protein